MEEFDALYRRYLREVYRYLLRLCKNEFVAEELTQSTFTIAFEKLETFRGESKISVWLCQIAKFEYYNWRRKNKDYTDEELENVEDSGNQPLEYVLRKEEHEQLYKILKGLKEPYKEVFLLRNLGEMNFRDIGNTLGRSESWARVTYYRARKMLMEHLDEKMGEEETG